MVVTWFLGSISCRRKLDVVSIPISKLPTCRSRTELLSNFNWSLFVWHELWLYQSISLVLVTKSCYATSSQAIIFCQLEIDGTSWVFPALSLPEGRASHIASQTSPIISIPGQLFIDLVQWYTHYYWGFNYPWYCCNFGLVIDLSDLGIKLVANQKWIMTLNPGNLKYSKIRELAWFCIPWSLYHPTIRVW